MSVGNNSAVVGTRSKQSTRLASAMKNVSMEVVGHIKVGTNSHSQSMVRANWIGGAFH